MVEALGESENELREPLVKFLEGEETWEDEMAPIFNALEPSDRKKFYRVLKIKSSGCQIQGTDMMTIDVYHSQVSILRLLTKKIQR